MKSYFFCSKPENSHDSVHRKAVDWSCKKGSEIGDVAIVYVLGVGIKYEFWITSEPWPDYDWKYMCRVKRKATFDPIITIAELRDEFKREWGALNNNFRDSKAILLKDDIAERIRGLRKGSLIADQPSPVSVDTEKQFIEGERRAFMGTVRNAALRLAAKEKWGLTCYCCGFDFELFYGDLGEGIAIVHHLEMFPANGKQRKATAEDVRVVCANCHAVIHAEKTPIDVDELRARLSCVWNIWTKAGVARKTVRKRSWPFFSPPSRPCD